MNQLPYYLLAIGTDAEMQVLVDKMWAKGQEINNTKFDYEIPIWFTKITLCHAQNSNIVVKVLVEAAGLSFKLPVDSNEKAV